MDPDEKDDIKFEELEQDEIEKLLQDLNEPHKEISMQRSSDDATNIDMMEFIDSFLISNTTYNHTSVPDSTRDHFTALLLDFDEFEKKMLPPNYQTHFADCQGGTKDSDLMVEEMADGTLEFVMGSRQTLAQSIDRTSHFPSMHNVGTYGSGSSSTGRVYYMRCSNVPRYGLGNSRGEVGMNDRVNFRKRKKRKYRGVIETEQQIARRLELTKIKNREAAARAHDRKKAHEVQLQSQLSKLRQKNKYLRNLVMFHEAHKRMDMPPKPLKRTISGPL